MIYIARYKDNKIEVTEHKVTNDSGATITFEMNETQIANMEKCSLNNKGWYPNEVRSRYRENAVDRLVEMLEERMERLRVKGSQLLKAIVSYGRG